VLCDDLTQFDHAGRRPVSVVKPLRSASHPASMMCSVYRIGLADFQMNNVAALCSSAFASPALRTRSPCRVAPCVWRAGDSMCLMHDLRSALYRTDGNLSSVTSLHQLPICDQPCSVRRYAISCLTSGSPSFFPKDGISPLIPAIITS